MWSVECEVQKCGMWSVKRKVWNVEYKVLSVKCGVERSVKCGF